eukprot:GHVU01233465.1.p2 GENE.GHVU01233465.1~~GHVU01233465.1.p2  ORF type:complete len:131 (-),score=13.12 GHVU01233465.1:921-1313(-)
MLLLPLPLAVVAPGTVTCATIVITAGALTTDSATVWPGRVNLEQAKVLMYEANRLPDRIYYHAGDASTKAFLQWASRRGFDFRHFNIDLIAIGEDILAKYTLRWRTGNTKIRVGQPSQSVSQSVSQGMGA